MGTWERDNKSKEDQQQTIFMDGAIKQKPRTTIQVTTLEGVALCPFCLFGTTVDKFVFSVKGGFHKGLGKCPRCKNMSKWKTLKRQWKVKEFALWCHQYSCDGFWAKVKYKEFNDGLRRLNVLEAFWTRYKELKGDVTDENESYTQHLERTQKEQAIENGWIEA